MTDSAVTPRNLRDLSTSHPAPGDRRRGERFRVMWMSTIAFTLMFAVWLQFGILQGPISEEFGLTTTQVAWLIAVPSINGSIWRLVTGIMADRWGGRVVMVALMLATVIPTFLVIFADSYAQLLLFAFLIGLAGNSFTVGISWNSAWFPKSQQGLALGVFGAGNVGASVTKLVAPGLLAAVPGVGILATVGLDNWRLIPVLYAVLLLVGAAITWFTCPTPDLKPGAGVSLRSQLAPLNQVRVWRFALYYVVVFGAYVALSGWMPRYFMDTYDIELAKAGLLTALFIFPASLLRPLGGWASDRRGARPVLWTSFTLMIAASALMMLPNPLWLFTVLLVVLGVGMGIGKAAVYKHIPEYFPRDVGAVGGLVGLLGGLGAVALPPTFAYANEWTGAGTAVSTFGTMTAVTAISMLWMGVVIARQRTREVVGVTAK